MDEDLDKVAPEAKALARTQSHEQPPSLKRESAIDAPVVDIDARSDALGNAQGCPDIRPGGFTQAHLKRRRGGFGAEAGQAQQAAITLGDDETNVVKAAAATPPASLNESIVKPVMKVAREPEQRTVVDPCPCP